MNTVPHTDSHAPRQSTEPGPRTIDLIDISFQLRTPGDLVLRYWEHKGRFALNSALTLALSGIAAAVFEQEIGPVDWLGGCALPLCTALTGWRLYSATSTRIYLTACLCSLLSSLVLPISPAVVIIPTLVAATVVRRCRPLVRSRLPRCLQLPVLTASYSVLLGLLTHLSIWVCTPLDTARFGAQFILTLRHAAIAAVLLAQLVGLLLIGLSRLIDRLSSGGCNAAAHKQ